MSDECTIYIFCEKQHQIKSLDKLLESDLNFLMIVMIKTICLHSQKNYL